MNNNIDLCFLQETFMSANDTAIFNEVKSFGLKMFSVPRDKGSHGGLGLIYKPHINIKLIGKSVTLKKFKTFEYIEFTMKSNQGLIRFCNLYRRPYSQKHRYTVNHFLIELEEYLELLVNKPGLPVVLGDLNIHMEKLNDSNTIAFKGILEQFSFVENVHNFSSTHRDGGELDVIFCTESLVSFVSDTIVYPDGTPSDHYMVSCNLHCDPELYKSKMVVKYRNFKSIDISKFKDDLKKSVLLNVVDLPDVKENINLIANLYNEELGKLMDKHCPIIHTKRSINTNGKKDRWFDEELRNMLRNLRKTERKWYKSRDPNDKLTYKQTQKLYVSTVKHKRKESNSNQIISVKKDKRKLFIKLNKLLGKEKACLPECNSNKELSEDFASHFVSKINKIREEIYIDKDTFDKFTGDAENEDVCDNCTYKGEVFNEFKLLLLEDLQKLMQTMTNKFCCLDPIPTWLLNECFDKLGPVLVKLINLSLKFGTFPHCYKNAVIKPTVKDYKASTDSLSNYRPVSNISFVSKLIEKAVLNQLDCHLKSNDLYCSSQSGYQRFHSCETLNIRMFDDVLKSIDEGSTVALLLLDMSAAFDTVDHGVLLKLLNENYGLTDMVLNWFKDYLHGRTCSVNISDCFSDAICLLFGVPQGSILGPILFILYTKHLQHIAMKYGLNIQLYADDTQLYISFNKANPGSITACKENIEKCLQEIKSWMCGQYLKMNEGKTKLLFLNKPSRGQDTISNNFTITACNSVISEYDWLKEKPVKSLGLYLDPLCIMDKQVSNIKKYCYGELMCWRRIASSLTEDVKTLLVQQIILSKIDYNNALLVSLPNNVIESLQSIINSAIRFIYGLQWRDHITPYIVRSHILPVKYRIEFKICMTVFNCLFGFAPKYLQELLTWNVPTRDIIPNSSVNIQAPRTTQDPLLLIIPMDFGCKTRYRNRSFSHCAPRSWNKLPFSLRACQNKDKFKTELKTFLFQKFLTDNGL